MVRKSRTSYTTARTQDAEEKDRPPTSIIIEIIVISSWLKPLFSLFTCIWFHMLYSLFVLGISFIYLYYSSFFFLKLLYFFFITTSSSSKKDSFTKDTLPSSNAPSAQHAIESKRIPIIGPQDLSSKHDQAAFIWTLKRAATRRMQSSQT